MLIIGCDYHPGFQQIALVDTSTGELRARRREVAHRLQGKAVPEPFGIQHALTGKHVPGGAGERRDGAHEGQQERDWT